MVVSLIPTKMLLSRRRLDLMVKWRFFRHLEDSDNHINTAPQVRRELKAHVATADNSDAARVYRWHIEKRNGRRMDACLPTDQWKLELDDYVAAAEMLWKSMSDRGFDSDYPVPIDPDGEMLDGAHRVACALALGLRHVPVLLRQDRVWAPAWDYPWFIEQKMPTKDMKRVLNDWFELNGGYY